ncbi:neuroblast differentiation-associated protein AHNAK-like [Betta splendens]|uniref:Neuroblast differentiation-associated protein AHNAK-like n=1 Tax=Betta splendens TaxID=158456 RepID=A0A6P7LM14_BETSP|nr:neuroblast differentiation-associated protein AHNAK-like [Betta splendens]XP_055361869.1 neuroblast differentiation-associated protein AHNAK-like [Betta splendens]
MCDCFHLAFPNWHAASSGTAGRRLRGPELGTEEESICDEPSQFTEGERPRPQGSSPVEEYPEPEKYTDSDQEFEAGHDLQHKSRSGKKTKKSGLGSMFDKRSTPKMSKLKEVHSPESGVIVKTAKDGCAEGLIYSGGGKEGIFIKQVVPESPASKSLKLQEGDQILSATVYFDNIPYEDAIQILEHAQAYNVKLCLKRKPHTTETEAAIDADVIPNEDLYAPELRAQGKTKRRGDARISWPKFPSLGRKSRFTRSHSSSEADEQKKLELSPPTSDTESPIKSQDALKGKKRQKMKLSVLKNRGRISSSEDQDTEAPTTGQISGDIYQTASEILSPECLESLSVETADIYVTEDQKVVEVEQNETKTVQHKVELLSIDGTLKTTDLTVALTDQERPSGITSPQEKKKKKEKSELKIRISGKDKKDAKAKSSPKRLKTLGASFEIAEQRQNETLDVIPCSQDTQLISSECSRETTKKSVTTQREINMPKVELDISDVTFMCKPSKKGEERAKTGRETKQKQDTKTMFKLPKIGLSDVATEEPIKKIILNDEEYKPKFEHLSAEGTIEIKADPFDRLPKSNLSTAQLPKREDIEIPGMEDMTMTHKAKKFKEPKTDFKRQYEEIPAESVQLSIDVDSVKEAVSKLPGFKLPKVDTSGMPIPEEITVIDANAQRISVKTPTKVVDTKAKHEGYFTKFDMTASPHISKSTIKLPNISPGDLTSDVLITETRIDIKKTEMEYKTQPKQSDTYIQPQDYNRDNIMIPGKEDVHESAMTQSQKIEKSHTVEGQGQIEGLISDVKIPEIDNIEYIDSVSGSPAKTDCVTGLTGVVVNVDAEKSMTDSFAEMKVQVKYHESIEHSLKLPKAVAITPKINTLGVDITTDAAKMKTTEREESERKCKEPKFDVTTHKVKGPDIDLSLSQKDTHITLPLDNAKVKITQALDFDSEVPFENADVSPNSQVEIKPLQIESDFKGQVTMFKMPKPEIKMSKGAKGPEFDLSLSKNNADVLLQTREVKLPETDVTLGIMDKPELKTTVEKPELEFKPLQTEGDLLAQEPKFKMPKLGIKMPKIKGLESDQSFSKKDVDITLPEGKIRLTDIPEVGGTDVLLPEQNIKVEKPELEIKSQQFEFELDTQGTRFKMPKLGIKMPKIKGPEIDLNLSKKDTDVLIPDNKGEVKRPEAHKADFTLGNKDVSLSEQKIKAEKPDLEFKPTQTEGELDVQGAKFKIPKFHVKIPKVKAPEMDVKPSHENVDVQLPEVKGEVNLPDVDVSIAEAKTDLRKPEIELPDAPNIDVSFGKAELLLPDMQMAHKQPIVQTKPMQTNVELLGGKFKMPKLGITMPKVQGPERDLNLLKKNADVTLSEPTAEIGLPVVQVKQPSSEEEIKAPEIKVLREDKDGSPSKFKMPTFKLPKFGMGSSSATVEVPDMDKDIKMNGADIIIPEEVLTVSVEGPSVDMKTVETDYEGKGGKFKLPSLGFSVSKGKGQDADLSLSKGDADMTLPEVKLPVAEVKQSSAEVEIKAPELNVVTKDKDGSPSKFKMPTFKLPKFGIDSSSATIEIPEMDKNIKMDAADITIPEDILTVSVEGPTVDIKTVETDHEGKGGKFKLPSLGFSASKGKVQEHDLSLSKVDADVTVPEVKLPDIEVKQPSVEVEIKAPEIIVVTKYKDRSQSKFKMPTIKLPKFGIDSSSATIEVSDMDKDIKIDGADIKIPEEALTVSTEGPSVNMKTVETDHEGKEGKFKLPSLGFSVSKGKVQEHDLSLSKADADVTVPEVKLPDIEVKQPSAKVEIKAPELKVVTKDKDGSPSKFKMPTFKLPKFGMGSSSATVEVPDMDKDMKIDGADIKIPEEALTVSTEGPSVDMKTVETDHEGKEGKFKLPSLGFSVSKGKVQEHDLSLSKADADVTVPEVKLPDIEVKQPSAEVEIKTPELEIVTKDKDGSPSKFKMPTFKLPKFGMGSSSATVEVPDMDKDMKIDGADIKIPEEALTVSTEGPSVDIKTVETDHEGKEGKFKLPSLGFSVSKGKVQEHDLSLSKADADVTVPEVKLPDIEVKQPSAEVEIKAPELKVVTKDKDGSPSKFKMPTFKLPKFGMGSSSATVEVPDMDKDMKIDGADIKIPEEALTVSTEGPSVDMKTVETDHEGKEGKFKLPSLGFSVSKGKVQEHDLSISKADADVTVPEVKLPNIEVKQPSAEVEIKAPELKVVTKDKDGSPSKFKMPTFKLPKFGMGSSSATVEVPDMDKDMKIDGPDATIPQDVPTVSVEGPSVDMKTVETDHERKGGKFKLPSLGFSASKGKVQEHDLSLSKADTDVTLPKVKLLDIEVKQPSAEVEIKAPEIKVLTKDKDGSPSKFKMPTFKLPKFGMGSSSATVEVPDMDKDIKIDKADATIPEDVLTVTVEGLSVDMKTVEADHERKGGKFKLPSLGFSASKGKVDEPDLSLSKADTDVTLPKVKLPDIEVKQPSAEVEIKAPEIKVVTKDKDGSPSKFKMPIFKLPKFGMDSSSATVEVPDMDKDIKMDGADVTISEEVLTVSVEGPSVDMKTVETDHEGKGGKFKLPSLGFSASKGKGQDADLTLSKGDADMTLPEVKLPVVEVKQPSAEVEIKAPEIKVLTKDKDGSPSKFKMPTFKMPKFGMGSSSATVEVPDMDKDIKMDGADVTIPEEVLTVSVEGPSVDMKTVETDHEGKGGKFKLPSLGFSASKGKVHGHDLTLSKGDADMTLPEVKLPVVEVKQPSAEVEIKAPEIKVLTKDKDESPSKFKMPTFKLPKFGMGSSSATVEVPDMDKNIKMDGADATIPEDVLTVSVEGPSVDMKTVETDHEGKGDKFKLPSLGFSVSKGKVDEPDLSLIKADTDVTLPKVKLPDIEVKKPSAEVEIKAPEIKVVTKDKDGSPSKFKMPTFKLPKFGMGSSSATVEVPDMDKDIKIDRDDATISEEVLTVSVEGPSVDMKTVETDHEGKGGKFKLPSLGFSASKGKGQDPDLTLSKEDADMTLPEVKLPVVEVKQPSAEVEIKAPEIKVLTKDKDGSPSKFKMPTFKLPKFGMGSSSATVEFPDMDKDIEIDRSDATIPEEVLTVSVEGQSVDMKTVETDHEGKGGKFKLPSLGFSVSKGKVDEPDLSLIKADTDVTLPKGKFPDIEVKQPFAEVEIKAPEIKIETKDKDGSPSKFKMPTLKLPKFGMDSSSATVEVPDMDKDMKMDGADITIPKEVLSISVEGPSVDMKTVVTDHEGKGGKFKLPSLGFSASKGKVQEHDLSLSEADADVKVPEIKLPDIEVKQPSAEVEIKAPEIKVVTKDKDESPSKFKLPTFKLPKFGMGSSSATIEVPDMDKDIKMDGADITIPEDVLTVSVEGQSVDIKTVEKDHEGKGGKFKLPSLGFSASKGKGPDADLTLTKGDADMTLPEVKLPVAEVKQPSAEVEIKASEIKILTKDKDGSPSKFKMPTFKLPKFGVGRSSATVEVPEMDKNMKMDGADTKVLEEVLTVSIEGPSTKGPSIHLKAAGLELEEKSDKFKLPGLGFSGNGQDAGLNKDGQHLPEATAEIKLPVVEVKQPSAEGKIKEPEIKAVPRIDTDPGATVELDANWKKPTLSFSESSVKDTRVSAELSHVEVSLPEGEVKVKLPETETRSSELEAEHVGQKSKFKLPKLSVALPKAKAEVDLTTSQKSVDETMPRSKAEVKVPEVEVKQPSTSVEIKASEIQAKSKDVGGSPLKFKMPTLKFPGFSSTSHDVIRKEDANKDEDETYGATLGEEDVTVTIKAKSADIITDSETPKSESVGQGSPSKFKLPSFKMPKLSFLRSKPEDEYVPVETESKDAQLDVEAESKGDIQSTKMTLTSLGDFLKTIDVEFDVQTDKAEHNLETPKEIHATDKSNGKQLEAKEKQIDTKQETTRSPEKTGWFKLPKLGQSFTEPDKTFEKGEHKEEETPVGETVEEESPTSSVQSSDAFADISSTMTSEPIGFSSFSPTKVTVKYSDPNAAAGVREIQSNIITSTTKTETISVEPNLPEKITILSSGVTSSSEDTLTLESGKIHDITSNVHATLEAHQAKLLTAVQGQSAGGLPLKSEANEATSWTVEDSQGGRRTVIEKHVIMETRGESSDTIVITKQVTKTFKSSEPLSGETASSIQRLRDSVHSEKMKFFDEVEK